MRITLAMLLFLAAILTSCRKNDNDSNNPVRNDEGYLLSRIIEGRDTTDFQYDNNNNLIGLSYFNSTYNYQGIYDSIQYNSKSEIVSFKYTYKGNTSLSNVHNFSYLNDTIIETSFNLPYADYGDAIKFILSNDRIIETRLGAISNGIILSSGFWDTTHYFYDGDNLMKCSYRFLTSTYQPIDTFLYDNNLYNPHLLLGKHVWSLLIGPGRALVEGESKNIPSDRTYATYYVAGTTLMDSGFSSFQMTTAESFKENPMLPKVIKYLKNDGTEMTTQYFYQRQK